MNVSDNYYTATLEEQIDYGLGDNWSIVGSKPFDVNVSVNADYTLSMVHDTPYISFVDSTGIIVIKYFVDGEWFDLCSLA